MAWTSPRTWTTAELVSASMLNTHVRDNLLAITSAFPSTLNPSGDNTFDLGTQGGTRWRHLALSGGITINNPASGTAGSGQIKAAGAAWIEGALTLTGHLTMSADNTYDIGAAGATRPRNVYVAGAVSAADQLGAARINLSGSWSPASQVGGINSAGGATAGASLSAAGIFMAPQLTKSASTGSLVPGLWVTAITQIVSGGVTCDRIASAYLDGQGFSGGGTVTNNNSLYLGSNPSGGGTVRVIDSVAGAYLTTGGIWTNNPSWSALKEHIRPMKTEEITGLLDWLRVDYQPVRYRYRTADGPHDQGYEYDHLGFLLDDMPQHIREIVCADADGGISTKDTEGFLLALVKGLAVEVAALRQEMAR